MDEELKDKIQDIIDEAELKIELAFIEFEQKTKLLFIENYFKNNSGVLKQIEFVHNNKYNFNQILTSENILDFITQLKNKK